MPSPFVRQLGSDEPGVQLNPLQDSSGGISIDNSDQKFAIAMRAERGAMGRAFTINDSTMRRKIGFGGSLMSSALNEAYLHVYEALKNGAYEVVVYRLLSDEAKLQWIVVTSADNETVEFSLSDDEPTGDFIVAIKHLECFNDGIKVSLHADELDNDEDNKEVTLNILSGDNELLASFTGSLDPVSTDDYKQSDYLPNVAGMLSNDYEVIVGNNSAIKSTSAAYGRDEYGYVKSAKSDTLIYFTEGSTDYSTQDYQKAKNALHNTQHNFSYVSTGGSVSPGLLIAMSQLAFDNNVQVKIDIPGHLTPSAAVDYINQLNLTTKENEHLISVYWSPLKHNDPSGMNGKIMLGASTYNIAKHCLRNAATNAHGFSRKNHPVAGKSYPIARTGVIQTYDPTSQEKDAMAKAHINPVLYETYSSTGSYVFTDFLTLAKTKVSGRKLTSIVDMSTTIDDWIARKGKEVLRKPMSEAIRDMETFLENKFRQAKASGWLIEGQEGAYSYTVQPSEIKPSDCLIVNYSLHFDGAVRQVHLQQELTR